MANPVTVELAYKAFEPVNGADNSLSPVIFLHGMTGTKEHWTDIPQIVADKTKRRTYAVDARNHGESKYTEEFHFDLNVEDLLHFMDSIDASNAILVGHSMGGVTATRAALKHPERVEAVFCEDMYTKKVPQDFTSGIVQFMKVWLNSVENIPKGTSPDKAVQSAIDHLYNNLPKDSPFFDEQKFRNARIKLKQTPDGGYDVCFNKDVISKALQNVDTLMSDPSGQYTGKAYFIYGTLSPIGVDKEEENIRKHFPNLELIKFEDATHDVHGEFPEKFVETLLERLI